MEEIYFMHRIRHTKGVWDKGIEVKEGGTTRENLDAAKQSYHARQPRAVGAVGRTPGVRTGAGTRTGS